MQSSEQPQFPSMTHAHNPANLSPSVPNQIAARFRLLSVILVWGLSASIPERSRAAIHYQRLRSFGANGDGGQPAAQVIQGADGALYGTTSLGGASNVGTVFRLNRDGSAYRILYSFGADTSDVANPLGELPGRR